MYQFIQYKIRKKFKQGKLRKMKQINLISEIPYFKMILITVFFFTWMSLPI